MWEEDVSGGYACMRDSSVWEAREADREDRRGRSDVRRARNDGRRDLRAEERFGGLKEFLVVVNAEVLTPTPKTMARRA